MSGLQVSGTLPIEVGTRGRDRAGLFWGLRSGLFQVLTFLSVLLLWSRSSFVAGWLFVSGYFSVRLLCAFRLPGCRTLRIFILLIVRCFVISVVDGEGVFPRSNSVSNHI